MLSSPPVQLESSAAPPGTIGDDLPNAAPSVRFEQLYFEIKRRARSALRGHSATSDPTSLVHEAWLRLRHAPSELMRDPAGFVAYAARTMRHLLIDDLRRRRSQRCGGDCAFITLDSHVLGPPAAQDIEAVHEALDRMALAHAHLTQVVELHFFAGLTFGEVAALRGVSERTVQRDWTKARILLAVALRPNSAVTTRAF